MFPPRPPFWFWITSFPRDRSLLGIIKELYLFCPTFGIVNPSCQEGFPLPLVSRDKKFHHSALLPGNPVKKNAYSTLSGKQSRENRALAPEGANSCSEEIKKHRTCVFHQRSYVFHQRSYVSCPYSGIPKGCLTTLRVRSQGSA